MTNTLTRILKRDQPKAHIVEGMTKLFFQKTGAEDALISIKENRNTRTSLQNDLYWVIVGQIRRELNCSEEVMHKHLREELTEVTYETVAGKRHMRLKSTTKMNTKEMGEYISDSIDYIQGDLLPGFKLNLPEDWRELVN
jgi:hypothetical protein